MASPNCVRVFRHLSVAAALCSVCGSAAAQAPTADEPILFAQIKKDSSYNAQTWWPYRFPADWHPHIVPMIPLNAMAFPSAIDAANSVRAFYVHAVNWLQANQIDPAGFEQRLAVQFFNFGGNPGSVLDDTLQSPTEFWAGAQHGDSRIANYPLSAAPEAAHFSPWMPQRSAAAKAWMEQFLQTWGQFSSPSLPPPVGGVYFDTEHLFPIGTDPSWRDWAASLGGDPRWFSRPVPDFGSGVASGPSMQVRFLAARDLFVDPLGQPLWPTEWAASLADAGLKVDRNRQFHLWLTDVGNDVITRTLKYTAYDPIAAAWDETTIPIANYDNTSFERRLATPTERFGWHLSRSAQGGTLGLSRGGWLGAAAQQSDEPNSTTECPQCVKAPFPLFAQSPTDGDPRLGPPVGPWQMNYTTRTAASLHAPVFYPVWLRQNPLSCSDPWPSRTHMCHRALSAAK